MLRRTSSWMLPLLVLSCSSSHSSTPAGQLASGVIGAMGGGVATPDGISIFVPAGALDHDVTFTISSPGDVPDGAIKAVEIGPSGTQFKKPATVTFPFTQTSGTNLNKLKIMTVADGVWKALLNGSLNTSAHQVSGDTAHLSPYALVSSSEDCSNKMDDDGDGLVDCADPACQGDTACKGGGPKTCMSESDCPGSQLCVDGVCTGGGEMDAGMTMTGPCRSNAECPNGEFCVDGMCIGGDTGADGGTATDAGAPCHKNSDCTAPMVCALSHCQSPPDAGTHCADDSDCYSTQFCSLPEGVCVDYPMTDGGTVCSSDWDCNDSALVCMQHMCVPAPDAGPASCSDYSDCTSDEVCLMKTCHSTSESGLKTCITADDCGGLPNCPNGYCSE